MKLSRFRLGLRLGPVVNKFSARLDLKEKNVREQARYRILSD